MSQSRIVLTTVLDHREAATATEFLAAIDTTLRWAGSKAEHFPSSALRGERFESNSGAIITERLTTDAKDIWAARVYTTDDEARQWTTEIALTLREIHLSIAVRLICLSSTANFDFLPASPGVIRRLAVRLPLSLDDHPLTHKPIIVDEPEELDPLIRLLEDPKRRLSVIVTSRDRYDSLPIGISHYENAARRLCGAAHLFILGAAQAQALSETLGRGHAPRDGAIKTFLPGFNRAESDPFQHPLALGRTLRERVFYEEETLEPIIRGGFRYTVSADANDGLCPSYAAVRAEAAGTRSQFAVTEAQRTEELRLALEAANDQRQEAMQLALEEEEERKKAEEEIGHLRNQIMYLKSKITAIETGANISFGSDDEPASYADIGEWVDRLFADTLVLHNRARRSLKKAKYKDIATVIECIKLLGTLYHGARTGKTRYENFTEQLQKLGVSLSGSISQGRAGQEGEKYFVDWGGRRTFIEYHLVKGTSMREEEALRIYFFWDAEAEQVVICWLPSHLPNRLT